MNCGITRLRIGSRGSRLALLQTAMVIRELRRIFPDLKTEIIEIKTEGDSNEHSSLTRLGGTGVFIKTIEEALLDNRIDAAVHSAKDLPSQLDDSFSLPAVLKRGSYEDVLLSGDNDTLESIPEQSLIGSSSPRRIAQLLRFRPDLRFENIRGNINTRLRKLNDGNYDGIILARAALERLELTGLISQVIPVEICLPAPGQGVICIETLESSEEVNSMLSRINNEPTYRMLTAERTFLKALNLGCGLPVAALATINDSLLTINGRILDNEGKRMIEKKLTGSINEADSLGKQLGELLLPDSRDLLS